MKCQYFRHEGLQGDGHTIAVRPLQAHTCQKQPAGWAWRAGGPPPPAPDAQVPAGCPAPALGTCASCPVSGALLWGAQGRTCGWMGLGIGLCAGWAYLPPPPSLFPRVRNQGHCEG